MDGIFNRTELLFGSEFMARLKETSVIIFGIGGVGSWCAEGLVRSGIGKITIVDSDVVNVTNINRQLMATTSTIGTPKTEALRARLVDINPDADVTAIQDIYCEATADKYDLDSYDYVIDAIDTLKDKMTLLLNASRSKAKLFSSMGAACKIDPTKIKVAEFWKVRGCPLGAAIRKKMHQKGTLPAKKFYCVYDDEVLPNLGKQPELETSSGSTKKAVTNGTTAPITAIFGMTLSALVIQDLYGKSPKSC